MEGQNVIKLNLLTQNCDTSLDFTSSVIEERSESNSGESRISDTAKDCALQSEVRAYDSDFVDRCEEALKDYNIRSNENYSEGINPSSPITNAKPTLGFRYSIGQSKSDSNLFKKPIPFLKIIFEDQKFQKSSSNERLNSPSNFNSSFFVDTTQLILGKFKKKFISTPEMIVDSPSRQGSEPGYEGYDETKHTKLSRVTNVGCFFYVENSSSSDRSSIDSDSGKIANKIDLGLELNQPTSEAKDRNKEHTDSLSADEETKNNLNNTFILKRGNAIKYLVANSGPVPDEQDDVKRYSDVSSDVEVFEEDFGERGKTPEYQNKEDVFLKRCNAIKNANVIPGRSPRNIYNTLFTKDVTPNNGNGDCLSTKTEFIECKENVQVEAENEIEGVTSLNYKRIRKSGVDNFLNHSQIIKNLFITDEAIDSDEITIIEDEIEKISINKIENEIQANETGQLSTTEPKKKISFPKLFQRPLWLFPVSEPKDSKVESEYDLKSYFESIFGRKISGQEAEGENSEDNISELHKVLTVSNLLFPNLVLDTFLNLGEEKELKELKDFIKVNDEEMKTEELLSDVLFAVFSLMGPEDSCTWGLCLPMEQNGTTAAYVSLGQVKTFLKEAFQVSTEKMEVIIADVKKRQVADVSLKLKVLEAKELRPKTVKGGSNPYATVSIPSTQQSCRTRMEHETLSPKWNQEFTLSVKNMHKDVIHLQVWHEFDAHITNHFSEVKDVQSALRLLKGTNALAHKQEAHLLGSVQVPVKQIKENGIDDWFPLEKITLKEERKPRGLLHIKGEVSAANSKKNYGERRSYDALLARFVYHYIKTITNNNAEEEALQIPWRGQLSPEAVATLAQHSIILGLNGPLQHFSWWIVGSRVQSADAGWQLYQLQKVQNNMTSKSYSESDLENLSDSFYNWIKFALYKLRNLRASFPPSSGVIAKRQFASLLRICLTLQSHSESNALLQNKGIVDLLKQVGTAVTDYAKEWWSNLVEEQLRGVIKPEEQIMRVVNIASETFTFLEEVALFYGPTLLSEASIPYFREIFILLTIRLNPCIRPPLMNIYSHLTQNHDCHQDVVDNVTDNLVSFVFENGSLLWTLYINLGRIHGLGNDLPKEVREESGIYEYHKWFNKAVRRWVDLAKQRALAMINKAVELDNFEAIDEYCNFSSSATDVIGIFTEVQIWWKYLSWPDPENSMVLLAKILEDICSYGMTYADLLKNKVENMFSDNPNAHELSLSKQICTGLNNIDRVKNDINNLPDMFGVNILSEKIRTSQTGGEEVANRFINNVNTLIESSAENMEAKVNEFIEVVIEKMGSALHNAVVEACEVSSDKPLLVEVLDPALKVIHSNMNDSNFRMFLHRLWDMLIHLFKVTITQNTDKRKASYFNGVFSIIENCLKFVSPSDGAGLTSEEAKSEEYYELVELLQCLRLSSEHLISKYYAERYDEQNLHSNPGRGELVARAYFTRSGKLTVEVIMAKDMQLNHECGSLSTLASQFSSQSQYVDAYVKVHLVPSEWFPNVHEVRTKIQRKSDPAVFEETFDFEVTQEDSGVESSFILFTLKDHNLGRSNTLIGEALIPLKELSCVDSNLDHGVQNMYLKITTPGIESGYQSLRALKMRTSDRVATAFLKRNGPRISVDNKFKGINNLNPEDEKSRSRSPRLLHKIFA